METKDRVPGLDGLRAVSLLLVLQAHWEPWAAFNASFEWGRSGLLIFFVLSGFLITRILMSMRGTVRKKWSALRIFYARRFFRIQPIYYAALAYVLIINLNTSVSQDWAYHVLFVNNISNVILRSDIGVYGPAAPWWSLAVEEQFYVFWAPVVLLLATNFSRTGLTIAFAAALAWRVYAWKSGLLQAGFLITFGDLDSLAAGATVAMLVASEKPREKIDALARASLFCGIGLFIFLLFKENTLGQATYRGAFYGKVLGDIPIYLIIAPLIYFLATGRAKFSHPVLESRLFVFVGRRSYGAYVLHQVVAFTLFYYFPSRLIFRALRKLFGITLTFQLHGTLEFFVFSVITIALATISYRYFEVPIMRYRDRHIAAS